MTKLAAAEVRSRFAEALNRAHYGKERVVITRSGKPLAALISFEDLELLQRLEDLADLRAVARARAEVATKGSVPLAEAKRRAGI